MMDADDPLSPLARIASAVRAPVRDEREQRALLTELGFYGGGREPLKLASDALFARLTGSLDGKLSASQFSEWARLTHGADPRAARACFHASDLDGSGMLNRHEFLLANDAFYHSNPPEHGRLADIRTDAVFLAFADDAERCLMTGDGFQRLVAHLCRCPSHTDGMMAVLAPADVRELSRDDFRALFTSERFIKALAQHRLSRTSLLRFLFSADERQRAGQGVATPRVVLDDRHEEASADAGIDVGRIASAAVPRDAVNHEFELDPRLRATSDWRGPFAAARGTELFALASNVIDVAMTAAHYTFTETFAEKAALDSEWCADGEILGAMLGSTHADRCRRLALLSTSCRIELARQPSVPHLRQPVKVFGDVHGQLRDLLLLFREFGMPSHRGGDVETVRYVFNGDFVDRGAHQVEVVALLMALKVMYPSRVFLLRGNHEFRDTNSNMGACGFEAVMNNLFGPDGPDMFETVHECFDWLPVACVVDSRVLVLHGGIGAGEWSLAELEAVERPIKELDPPMGASDKKRRVCKVLLEAMWSDPSDSDALMWRGVHWGNRQSDDIPMFGPDITAAFCEANGIDVVVRSHQCVDRGYKVMHSGHLITVFSARNYFGSAENDGALLLIAEDAESALRIRPKMLQQALRRADDWIPARGVLRSDGAGGQ